MQFFYSFFTFIQIKYAVKLRGFVADESLRATIRQGSSLLQETNRKYFYLKTTLELGVVQSTQDRLSF